MRLANEKGQGLLAAVILGTLVTSIVCLVLLHCVQPPSAGGNEDTVGTIVAYARAQEALDLR